MNYVKEMIPYLFIYIFLKIKIKIQNKNIFNLCGIGMQQENNNVDGFDMSEFSKLLSGPDGFKALLNSSMIKNLQVPDINNKENNDMNNTNTTDLKKKKNNIPIKIIYP